MEKKFKEFGPTSWSIDNKTAIYLLTVFITLAGILAYNALPKEKFPDIVLPQISVVTVYPGAAPKNVENLVTKPIEKKLKGITGVKKITSNSVQGLSFIMVEFNSDQDVAKAKQAVKDKVDEAEADLPPSPNEIVAPPRVAEIEFSEMPILFVNVSGDYNLDQLKRYADDLKDKIEGLKENTALIASLPPVVKETVLNAFVNSFHVVFLVAAPVTLLGFFLALFLRETPKRRCCRNLCKCNCRAKPTGMEGQTHHRRSHSRCMELGTTPKQNP